MRRVIETCIIMGGILFAGMRCTSTFTLLAQERASEAAALKALCQNGNVDVPEVTIADSLLSLGNELRIKGKEEEAYSRLDYAVIFYQLAYAKHNLLKSRKENKELETSLQVAQSKLATYEKLLEQLKTKHGGEEGAK